MYDWVLNVPLYLVADLWATASVRGGFPFSSHIGKREVKAFFECYSQLPHLYSIPRFVQLRFSKNAIPSSPCSPNPLLPLTPS